MNWYLCMAQSSAVWKYQFDPQSSTAWAQYCLDLSTLLLLPGLVPSQTSQAFLLNAYLTVDIFPSTQKRLVGFLLFWHHGKLRNFTLQPRMHGNNKYRTVPQITRFP